MDDVLQKRPSPVATESGTIMAQAQTEAATGDFSPSKVVEPHSYWKFAERSSHL